MAPWLPLRPRCTLSHPPGSGEGTAQAWRPLPPPRLPARKRRSCSLPPSSPCASGSKCPLLERTPATSDEGRRAAWSLLLPPASKGSRIHGHRGPGLRHVTRGGHSSTLGSPRGDHSRLGARTARRAAGLSWGGRPRAPRAARARAQGAVMQRRHAADGARSSHAGDRRARVALQPKAERGRVANITDGTRRPRTWAPVPSSAPSAALGPGPGAGQRLRARSPARPPPPQRVGAVSFSVSLGPGLFNVMSPGVLGDAVHP